MVVGKLIQKRFSEAREKMGSPVPWGSTRPGQEGNEGDFLLGFVFRLARKTKGNRWFGLKAIPGDLAAAVHTNPVAAIVNFHESQLDFSEEVLFAFRERFEDFPVGFVDFLLLMLEASGDCPLFGKKKVFKMLEVAAFHGVVFG
jgi:hypothetical protein